MDKKKLIVSIFFGLTLVTGVSAVYLGSQLQEQDDIVPDSTFAATRPNGVLDCGNPSTANPYNNEICNSPTDKEFEYCPVYNGNAIILNDTPYDKIRFTRGSYFRSHISMYVNDKKYQVCEEGETCPYFDVIFDTPQTNINIRLEYIAGSKTIQALGWQSPVNGICGSCYYTINGSCQECSSYPAVAISAAKDFEGYAAISEQCWGDEMFGDSDQDFDFNDLMIKVSGNNFPECKSLSVSPSSAPAGSVVSITCEATDDDGIDRIELAYNSTESNNWCDDSIWSSIGTATHVSGDTYTYDWTLPNAPGVYTIKADTYDTANDMCTGNPGGTCDVYEISSCPDCNTQLEILAEATPTPSPTMTPSMTPTGTPLPTSTPTLTPSATPTGTLLPTNTPYDKPTFEKPQPTVLPPTALDTPRDKMIAGVILIIIGIIFRYRALKDRKYT